LAQDNPKRLTKTNEPHVTPPQLVQWTTTRAHARAPTTKNNPQPQWGINTTTTTAEVQTTHSLPTT